MKITKSLLEHDINGLSDLSEVKKNNFHKNAKSFFCDLAKEIGLPKDKFDIRSNMGGIEVSGEVILHGDHIYVQVSESCLRDGLVILYRARNGRNDYCGKHNRFIRMKDLSYNENQMKIWLDICRRIASGEIND